MRLKNSRSSKYVFYKRTLNPQPKPETGQNEEAKKSTFTLSDKKTLTDSVNSNLRHPESVYITTRGAISSNMGKVFDPIGLLTPVMFQLKFLFQMAREQEIGCDDDDGATITNQLKIWMTTSSIWVTYTALCCQLRYWKIQLQLFCCVSEKVYGDAIHARSLGESQTKSILLCSKSRLELRKTLSIPRLEMCSTVFSSADDSCSSENGKPKWIYKWNIGIERSNSCLNLDHFYT